MTDVQPVIAVVGPGAVGGLLPWLLHRAGANVVVVGRTGSVERINAQGLRVTSGGFGEGNEGGTAGGTVPQGARGIRTAKHFRRDDNLALMRTYPVHTR